MKYFILSALLFTYSESSLADCPDLRGVYQNTKVIVNTPPFVDQIKISESTCTKFSIERSSDNLVLSKTEYNVGKLTSSDDFDYDDTGTLVRIGETQKSASYTKDGIDLFLQKNYLNTNYQSGLSTISKLRLDVNGDLTQDFWAFRKPGVDRSTTVFKRIK